MEPTEHCAKLRELIIDRKKPSFETSLSKQDILKTKPFFKQMNHNQQLASIKVCYSIKDTEFFFIFFTYISEFDGS
jgi:hypothetical protein